MDYIDKLRVFRSVVEMRSFTRAADMHGLARPVVSRAVADLEARFGSRLLHRTTRQVSLTETAERIYELRGRARRTRLARGGSAVADARPKACCGSSRTRRPR